MHGALLTRLQYAPLALATFLLMAPVVPERDRVAAIADGHAQDVLDELERNLSRTAEDERVRGRALHALGRESDALVAWAAAARTGAKLEDVARATALRRLDEQSGAALVVLRASHDDETRAELARLSSSRSWETRHRVLNLLEEIGGMERVDLEAVAILDLLEGDSCARRMSGLDALRRHARTNAALDAIARARSHDDGCLARMLRPVENTLRVKLKVH